MGALGLTKSYGPERKKAPTLARRGRFAHPRYHAQIRPIAHDSTNQAPITANTSSTVRIPHLPSRVPAAAINVRRRMIIIADVRLILIVLVVVFSFAEPA